MATITKKSIVNRIAAKNCLTQVDVQTIVQEFLDQVIDELARGNRLELRDFGVFKIRTCAARTAQNPKTLERVAIPPRKTVTFKLGRLMKQQLAGIDNPAHPSIRG